MTPIELARLTETSVHTVRFYSRIGLLKPRRNRSNGYRQYSSEHAALLIFVRDMRELGLSIADVSAFVRAAERPHGRCSRLTRMIEDVLPALEGEIARRVLLQRFLKALHRRTRKPGRSLTGGDVRRLIAQLSLIPLGEHA